MNLLIDNRQDDDIVDDEFVDKMRDVINAVLKEQDLEEDYEVSLSLVTQEEIRELNKNFRGIDSVTDVLSFPLDDEKIEGLPTPLGDIVICIDRAKQQAKDLGHSLKREIMYLTCHSMLHLLGYDHMDHDEKEIMRYHEKKIMKSLGVFK